MPDELATEVERLTAERDRLAAEVERRDQINLHGVYYDALTGGRMNLRFGGEPAMTFLSMLHEMFVQNGGQNYLTLGIAGKPPGHPDRVVYEVTIRNTGGVKIPADTIRELEAERDRLADQLRWRDPVKEPPADDTPSLVYSTNGGFEIGSVSHSRWYFEDGGTVPVSDPRVVGWLPLPHQPERP